MPIYVYGCQKDKSHPRVEMAHGINSSPTVNCQVCGERMYRVPQPFRYGIRAAEILIDNLVDKYNRMRGGEKVDDSDISSRPDKRKPVAEFHTRNYKKIGEKTT